MTPYYQDKLVTLYNADARQILPDLEKVDCIVTDPVWPNALESLPGSEDPYALLLSVATHFPRLADRCVIQLGCNSDVRILAAIPAALPFLRVATLDYIRPHYRGRILYTGDAAYIFGNPPPSEPGRHLMPGRFVETHIYPRYEGHPCPRVLGHVRWLLHWYARGTVLDPFAGGCTTAVACRQLGIHCTCIEISEDFCERAAKRLSTGQLHFAELPAQTKTTETDARDAP